MSSLWVCCSRSYCYKTGPKSINCEHSVQIHPSNLRTSLNTNKQTNKQTVMEMPPSPSMTAETLGAGYLLS